MSRTPRIRRPEDERLRLGPTFAYGLQHVLTMYGGIIAVPLIIGNAAGLAPAEIGLLIASCLFIGGLATILQSWGVPFFGSQLPLVQGVSFSGVDGHQYERVRGMLRSYDDSFDDYGDFLMPRLEEAWRLLAEDGTLYLHLDYREAHYAKVMLDAVFGRDCFLNELIWAYDYGAKSRRRWPTKHDTILVYVKTPGGHVFNSDDIDREPYMAPGLVTAEKAARGKLPTDVWWHTIVPTTGREKTGYPTQKPEGIIRRIVQASSRPGDRVLDLFAGSGTTGAVASALGREAVLVDDNPEAVHVMTQRMPHAEVTTF